MTCAQNPGTYLGARYRRIASRRGPQKANVAIQLSMFVAIWHMGHTGELYNDPGADYYTRLHPERAKKRALHQLEAMGYRVSLDPVGAYRSSEGSMDQGAALSLVAWLDGERQRGMVGECAVSPTVGRSLVSGLTGQLARVAVVPGPGCSGRC